MTRPRKAFLLAAGLGTRLRPLTDKTPKCLLPLGGKPLLFWWLRILERLGVSEALINTHHLADQVRAFLESASASSRVELRAVHEPKLLGSAGTIARNRDFVDDEEAFWIIYADTVIGADLAPLAELHARTASCFTFGLFRSPDPRSGGVVELGEDHKVLSFEEKPAQPKSDLVAAGVYVGGRRLLERLPRPEAIPPEGLDIGRHVLPTMVSCARALLLDGPVLDIGTPSSYERARRDWSRLLGEPA